ncbi:MAG: amidohydrolase, partial [Planctomycetota bacterium]|nr:amidohydrolase [Planctomycetota bacterium]
SRGLGDVYKRQLRDHPVPERSPRPGPTAGRIPRRERLADPLNQEQIISLCRRWPQAKIILAHVGRAYYLRCALGNLERLKCLPNLWYDLAMLNHWEVLEHLFAVVPPDKALYATDMPIALAPGKSVEINHQYTYITPLTWELAIRDTRGRIEYTSFVYEELRAIRRAVERAGLDQRFLRGLFFDNGMKLLHSIREKGG